MAAIEIILYDDPELIKAIKVLAKGAGKPCKISTIEPEFSDDILSALEQANSMLNSMTQGNVYEDFKNYQKEVWKGV